MVETRTPFAARPRTQAPGIAPSAAAAILAGLIAGTLALAVMQSMAMLVYDESPWKLLRMMAALVSGPGALAPRDEFDAAIVVTGLATHYTLSLLYALALTGLLRGVPRELAVPGGLAFGVALYVANLYGFTQLFPWFAEMRTADTLFAHAIFGVVVADAYSELAHRHDRGI